MTFEGTGLAGTAAAVTPKFEGQPCPAQIVHFDPDEPFVARESDYVRWEDRVRDPLDDKDNLGESPDF